MADTQNRLKAHIPLYWTRELPAWEPAVYAMYLEYICYAFYFRFTHMVDFSTELTEECALKNYGYGKDIMLLNIKKMVPVNIAK